MSATIFKTVSAGWQDVMLPPLTTSSGAVKVPRNDPTLTTAPSGLQVISYNGVGGYTCVAPTAGGPTPSGSAASQGGTGSGGDDGKILTFLILTAQAHVITFPANSLVGGKHIITFTGAIGNMVELQAYNGIWYVRVNNGVTLS